jgi:DNA-binding response OmpR family regulator
MARLNLPALIVSDIDMPGGDGASLLHAIRLDPALKSRQIVLMSGKPDLLAHRRSMEEGADDFLVKPFGLGEFLSCVKARFHRALLSWPTVDQSSLRASDSREIRRCNPAFQTMEDAPRGLSPALNN